MLTINFPKFDGELVTDEITLSSAASDYGHIVSRQPMAVLRPASVDDLIKLIDFARHHNIQVSVRGQGFSTQGQSLVEQGVVIDMATLNCVRKINDCDILVDAGITWFDLLQQTLPYKLTPPVLTDYLGLSVGGTLSVGGLGCQSFRFGAQTDNVLELEVITGTGELVICSPDYNSKLFNAVRASLGQFGIIVGARVRLVPAPSQVRVYTFSYKELVTFINDQELLIQEKRFDYIKGYVLPDDNGEWLFILKLAKYFNSTNELDNNALLAGLSHLAIAQNIEDKSYFDFANELETDITLLKQQGLWNLPHPWLNFFLPSTSTVSFVENVLKSLTVLDIGFPPAGIILLYAVNQQQFQTPFFSTPNSERFFLFSLLRTATPGSIGVEAMIKSNQQLFKQLVAIGGKRYPIDSVLMSQLDWRKHFEPLWEVFETNKHYFDPDNILAAGQGIF